MGSDRHAQAVEFKQCVTRLKSTRKKAGTRRELKDCIAAVRDEALPAATDEQHQFYVINLEGKSAEFDVLSMDVIWVQEFARAGWLRDVSHLLPPHEREEFFSAPLAAVTYEGRA